MPEPFAENEIHKLAKLSWRRKRVLLYYSIGLTALLLAGWFGIQNWEKLWTAKQQAIKATELLAKLGRENKPLSEEEFATALALCGSSDPETRGTALAAVAADAAHHNPHRKGWAIPIAADLAVDPKAIVRTRAIRALGLLRAREHIELIRTALRSSDAREATVAQRALVDLEQPAKK